MPPATKTVIDLGGHPELEVLERVVGSVFRQGMRELPKAGTRGLWAAIVLLTVVVGMIGGGLALHVLGDGSVREEARTSKVLLVWLVRRAHAQDTGDPLPPFPYDEL